MMTFVNGGWVGIDKEQKIAEIQKKLKKLEKKY